ncbi:MAG: NADH-quinone oxidoreductase subunit NuoH [Armatimonadota bacterium]
MGYGELISSLAKMVIVLGFVLLAVPMLIWMERKVLADIQARMGPNRVGPYGIFQSFADGIKLFFKEDVIPNQVDRIIYLAAPALSMTCALAVFSVIPFGGLKPGAGTAVAPDINVGLLVVLATMSMSVYGIVLAGWASNNKYSLLGGLRSSAQMISYELSLGLSVIGVLMLSGSLNLMDVVKAQQNSTWYVLLQPIGFAVYLLSAFAETNRVPFDLPEAETELVAGFHTEYSSMKFAMFFMGEYTFVLAHSALITTLFLGGWSGPILPGFFWFLAKVFALVYFFMWVRGTLPRLRYDQLMSLGWKVLLPLALVNVFLTGIGITLWQGMQ